MQPAPAPILRRFLAYLVDTLLLTLLTALTIYVMIGPRLVYVAIGLTVVEALYKPIMESRYGWTLGKLSQKIMVIDAATGRRPDFNQSLMRYLPWGLGMFASIFLILQYAKDPAFAEVADGWAYLDYERDSPWRKNTILAIIQQVPLFSSAWMVGDVLRQAIHDKLARTLVVNFPE